MPKSKKKSKSSAAEATILEIQNAPVAEARKEAAAGIITLARRNKKSGKVEPRPRGRQNPDF